ncbi:MAG: IclR family transcriptional regulator [Deltaproteobacteria bacterium]|nr:IclR family transcriptional regulator [Deltaproteobacteria bacterium]
MKKGPSTEERYLVPAVEQASRILFCLARADSSYMSLTEICSQVGVHKSKAFSILGTLQKSGLVQRNPEGKGYSLGPGLIELSRRFLDNLSAPTLAEPILDDLARKSGTTAALGLIAGKSVFVAAKREGGRPIVVTMRVGHRFPITYGSHGKAIAAFLPKKELQGLLKDRKLYFHGDPGRFDREKLMAEIEECRRRWFAQDTEETAPGLHAVAAPVLGPNARPIGYMVVLGLPSAEATRRFGPLVAEAGKALSRQLGARVEG